MKFIKNFFEKTEPLVQKGAKYHWLHAVHDGFFTFYTRRKRRRKQVRIFTITLI